MSVYMRNPDAPPDEAFEPGTLRHLVVGNAGRLLDPRRTPVTVIGLRPEQGFFIVRLDDFEDKGATWEIPFEDVGRYQFARDIATASPADIDRFEAAVNEFDRLLVIAVDPQRTKNTERALAKMEAEADTWLMSHSRFLRAGCDLPDPASRRGDPLLFDDLARYMDERGAGDIEAAFAAQYVRGPHAGEIVKGHRIVLAELGCVPYEGKVVRDPATFAGDWRRDRRSAHILARLAFMRALFRRLGLPRVALYRGMAVRGGLEAPRNGTFISATFSRQVAESHFAAASSDDIAILLRQSVPIERLFMTYHETAAMNERYLEAEAVLLWEPGNFAF
jgi:hypothetical protein